MVVEWRERVQALDRLAGAQALTYPSTKTS